MITWFRLGKKAPDKTRPLKSVLESRAQRKTILENAKYILQKVPLYLNRVIMIRIQPPPREAKENYVAKISKEISPSKGMISEMYQL